ncbi:CHAT domain-containing protein [Streptacidiphilus melanogenes]|uniref:CHAT domain-containing protein n=1 Tax=Streptacidiphilus melanogenes TaxID=411235 RepID=UPI0005A87EA0|nr:CHAT domain-containing protein [Streptacidiphilus melanogenes]
MTFAAEELQDLNLARLKAEAALTEAGIHVVTGALTPEREQAVRDAAERLTSIADRFQRAFDASPGAPILPATEPATALLRAQALAAEKLAELEEARGDAAAATSLYDKAADAWLAAGRTADLLRCLAAARYSGRDERNLDEDITRLLARLNAIDHSDQRTAGERAALESQLAYVYYHAGDSVEALLYLERARVAFRDSLVPPLPVLPEGPLGLSPEVMAYLVALQERGEHWQVGADISQLALQLEPNAENQAAFKEAAAAAGADLDEAPWDRLLAHADQDFAEAVETWRAAASKPSQIGTLAAEVADLDQIAASGLASGPERDAVLLSALDRAVQLIADAQAIKDPTLLLVIGDLVAIGERTHADLLLLVGRPQDALEAAQHGLKLLNEQRRPDVRASLLLRVVRAHLALDSPEQALQAASEGIDLVEERLRYNTSGLYTRDSRLRPWVELYQAAARCVLATGRSAHGVVYFAMLARARRITWDKQGLDLAGLEALDDERPAEPASTPKTPKTPKDAKAEDLRRRRRLAWDAALAHTSSWPPPSPAAAIVQQRLRRGEAALVYYWVGERDLAVALLTRDRVSVDIRQLTAARRDRLAECIDTLLAEGQDHFQAAQRVLRDIAEWADALLPDDPALLSADRLFVSAHGILHGFPIHALTLQGTQLGVRLPVTYLPNLSVLAEEAPPLPGPDTLILGVSQFPAHAGMLDLSGAEPALRQVADLHRDDGRRVTTLPQQTSRRYLNDLLRRPGAERYGVLHLSTHGSSVLAASPLESSLLLHDSHIDGLDIAAWRLDGAVVVATACSSGQRSLLGRSGAGRGLAGDEILGLQAGFFAAGAESVLGTLWPVSVDVAARVTHGFHHALLGGATADRALHRAIAEYRVYATGTDALSYRWTPFFLSARTRPRPFPSANPDPQETAR